MGRAGSSRQQRRFHNTHVHEETLQHYDLPYTVDPTEPDYFLVQCAMDLRYENMLVRHSRQVRDHKRFIESRTHSVPPASTFSAVEMSWIEPSQWQRAESVQPWMIEHSSDTRVPSSNRARDQSRTRSPVPMYPKVHRDYVDEKTLRYLDIPYEWRPEEPEYFLLLQELTQEQLELVFEHTYILRTGPECTEMAAKETPLIRSDSPLQVLDDGNDEGTEVLLELVERTVKERILPTYQCFKFMPPTENEARCTMRTWLRQLITSEAIEKLEDVQTSVYGANNLKKKALLKDCRSLVQDLA